MKFFISLVFFFCFSILVSAQNISIDKIKGFRLEKMEGRELIISFTTTLENISSKRIGVTIKKGKLYKDGECLGSFHLLKKIKLNSKSKDNINVRVKVILDKDLQIIEEGLLAMMGKKVEVKLTGMFKATWVIFWKKYPFEYKEKISLKNLFGK